MKKNIVVALGTRPEATKLGPVILELQKSQTLQPIVLSTGQHKQQLQDGLGIFGISPDVDLAAMTDRQTLPGLLSRIVPAASDKLRELKADYVLVHGDTLTTFATALAAYYENIPLGHVEAGLRSFNMREPFPEEANRRLTDVLTDLDLAPTRGAKENLLREGKNPNTIVVTGQTQVDAVRFASQRGELPSGLPTNKKLVAVTMHRRENWPVMKDLAKMLAEVAEQNPEHHFVYPVHLNPVVREAVNPALGSIKNFSLLEPLEYGAMSALMRASVMLITDSGGLQEEGASLGVPVVVLRNVTERPEGVAAGVLKLAGTEPGLAFNIIHELLQNEASLAAMRGQANPYGDGFASQRVVQAVAWRLGLAERPTDWQ